MVFDKFKPVPEKENFNVSKESQLLSVAKNLLGIFLLLIIILFILNLFASWAIKQISIESEIAFFKEVDFSIDLGGIDEEKTKYLEKILEKLDKKNPNRPDYEIKVVCNEEVNAFTAPGAKIYVNSGLIEKAKSENEIAFVIAHEISHIKNRDSMKDMIVGIPIILTTIFFPDTITVSNFESLIRIKYDKNTEIRADSEALQMINEVYGHVGGVVDFFDNINSGNFEFLTALSDHPTTKARIKNIKELIKTHNFKIGENTPLEKELKKVCVPKISEDIF